MEKPEWIHDIYSKAESDREFVDVIVSILKIKLKYKHDDFYFLEKSQTLLIRNVVAVSWNEEHQLYFIGFSVTTEAIGVAVLIQCLLMNGITNIKFQDSFYACEIEKDSEDSPVIYYGKDASTKYFEEIYLRNKDRATNEIVAESVLLAQDDNNKTFH